MVAEIRWNGIDLRLTSNPVLLDNVHSLADYFALQVQRTEEMDDNKEPNISWVSAFERAASYDGLVVFKPSKQDPSILITKIPDFFANIDREFC